MSTFPEFLKLPEEEILLGSQLFQVLKPLRESEHTGPFLQGKQKHSRTPTQHCALLQGSHCLQLRSPSAATQLSGNRFPHSEKQLPSSMLTSQDTQTLRKISQVDQKAQCTLFFKRKLVSVTELSSFKESLQETTHVISSNPEQIIQNSYSEITSKTSFHILQDRRFLYRHTSGLTQD